MKILVESTSTVPGFSAAVEKVLADPQVKGLFVLSCDGNGFTPAAVDPVLRKIPVPVFGGIFPAVIVGKEKMETGSILVGLYREPRVTVIPNLSDGDTDYVSIIDEKIPTVEDAGTMFVFVDGLAGRISAFIGSLFSVFGLELNYIGGGAGSLDMKEKPCLFTNRGLLRDCALLALLDVAGGVGVSHGWESADGPYRVTESEKNLVKTLDWRPAFDVYKEVVEQHDRRALEQEHFFDVAQCYPFGISKIGAERVIRAPVRVEENGALMCVGEVPEGSFIDIMKGDEASLITAAGKARELAIRGFNQCRPGEMGFTMFIDCIFRALLLKDRFIGELEAVYNPQLPMVGACTVGEIANSGNDYLEFYNETSVVALLEAI